MAPSDPDFPFEIDELLCTLIVPLTYPTAGKPRIQVTNKQLKRGFQLNIENGFAELVTEFPNATLLGLFNRLDKQLETLLSKEMAETMKIVRPRKEVVERSPSPPVPTPLPIRTPPVHETTPSFTMDQKTKAQGKRQLQLRQIVARLGRLKGFVEHTDGVTFTVPFQPIKKDSLPASVKNQSSVRLIVPELYDLVPPRIEFHGNNAVEARRIEHAFKQRVTTQADNALLAHVNYLSQNAHAMATMHTPAELEEEPTFQIAETIPKEEAPSATAPDQHLASESGKTHVHFIPRPPEWSASAEGDDWSSGDSFSSDDEEYSTGEDEQPAAAATETTTSSVERGILLSFPGLELYSVELLELVSLNITVKCERCKEVTDVLRIRNNTAGDHTGMKDESCRKCANNLAVGYRMDLIHANSSRAGYLDMDGCTPVDMLPSNFVPTCSECSTPGPAPGIVAVRGDSAMAICRECHKKMTIKIPEIKFLRVSTAAIRASQAPLRRKPKENLGIVAGQELPQRGRCKHYAKSYRWFRFSCCQRVFPCDRCHNTASDHPEEHANRILCGHCSREQNYSPEQCHFCHNSFVAKRGQGFWEGGKGTLMFHYSLPHDGPRYARIWSAVFCFFSGVLVQWSRVHHAPLAIDSRSQGPPNWRNANPGIWKAFPARSDPCVSIDKAIWQCVHPARANLRVVMAVYPQSLTHTHTTLRTPHRG